MRLIIFYDQIKKYNPRELAEYKQINKHGMLDLNLKLCSAWKKQNFSEAFLMEHKFQAGKNKNVPPNYVI